MLSDFRLSTFWSLLCHRMHHLALAESNLVGVGAGVSVDVVERDCSSVTYMMMTSNLYRPCWIKLCVAVLYTVYE